MYLSKLSVFVYTSAGLTFGPGIDIITALLSALWTTPAQLQSYLQLLQSIDFTEYDSRKLALRSFIGLRSPPPYNAYPFFPPELPLSIQARFQTQRIFVLLNGDYAGPLLNLQDALSTRDNDPNFSSQREKFYNALVDLSALTAAHYQFYSQQSFELAFAVVWTPL